MEDRLDEEPVTEADEEPDAPPDDVDVPSEEPVAEADDEPEAESEAPPGEPAANEGEPGPPDDDGGAGPRATE